MKYKVSEAIKKGLLIPHEEVLKSFSKKDREEIHRKARFIMARMELRRLRKEKKFSQEKLARKMKVKREFISRIESGNQNITLGTLFKIAQATGKEFKFTFE